LHLQQKRVSELAQALGPELLPLVCLLGHNRVLQVPHRAARARASERFLQQQHAPLAEQLLAAPSALFLVVPAAAEGAGFGAGEALKRADAGGVEHVAAAENHLHGVSAQWQWRRLQCMQGARRCRSKHLVVIFEIFLADGAGQRAVVAAPCFLLHVCPFLQCKDKKIRKMEGKGRQAR
jgi:hypothetical protein